MHNAGTYSRYVSASRSMTLPVNDLWLIKILRQIDIDVDVAFIDIAIYFLLLFDWLDIISIYTNDIVKSAPRVSWEWYRNYLGIL